MAWDKNKPAITTTGQASHPEILANWAAIEDVLGNLVKNSEAIPEELKNLTTAEIQQLENIGATTISGAQWGYLGAMTTHPIGGDGTAGRVLRGVYLLIKDGTNASTLKCEVGSRWNSDTIAEVDNIGKGATVGDFSLNADGTRLTIEKTGLSGNCLYVLGHIYHNASTVNLTLYEFANAAANYGIAIYLRSSPGGVNQDITALVDDGDILLHLFYITDT